MPLNAEISQIISSKTTITAMMPTAAPALNIPPTTEHPFKRATNKPPANMLSFLIGMMIISFENENNTKTRPVLKFIINSKDSMNVSTLFG